MLFPFSTLASGRPSAVAGSSVKLLLAFLLPITLALAPGCAGQPIDENDPTALMADAEADIESSHYQIAADKLRMIKNRFPYSKQAVEAQIRIADVFFLQESFAEAALAYETFRDLHPVHEKAAYAMSRAALSYYRDIPSTVARDMAAARKSLEAYEAFIARYPAAPEITEAKSRVAEIRDLLARKELYVGDFYVKRSFFRSAKGRFEKVLALYGETRAADEARTKLALCETRIREGKSREDSEREERARKASTSGLSSPIRPPGILGPGQ
jgi:outer membrane protein assembly factor BamD